MQRLAWLLLCALATPCFATTGFITSEQENNDTEGRANGPVGPVDPVSGKLSRRDIDWFWFDLPQPGRIDISLDHDRSNDFDWALYAASGPALARGESSAVPEAGSYAADQAGRYFVRLSAYRGSGSYLLDVGYDPGGDGDPDPTPDPGPRPAKPGNLRSWITGNPEDAGREPVGGPAMLLMGGSLEVDQAFAQRAFPIANGGDVVILRSTGSDGYNAYLYNLVDGPLQPDSVETLLLDSRDKADSDYAEWVVRNAELIFIAGGDQSAYLNHWQGTRVETAIRAAYQRGAVIGGTSAGLAVQGEHIYDPDGVTAVSSSEALADPYRGGMQFSTGFLDLPLMQAIITDSHFRQRDRIGRLLAFMARLRDDGTADAIIGLGIDERTALFIGADRRGVVDGDGAVYVLRERGDTERSQVAAGMPLVYLNLSRTRLVAGDGFDFTDGSTRGVTLDLSVDARFAPALSPADPY
jgi:cyanophycinase